VSDLDLVPFRLLIDRIVEPARRHMRAVFLPVALPLAIAGALAGIAQVAMLKGLGADPTASLPFLLGTIVLSIVYIVIYYFAYAAVTVAAMDAAAGRPVDMARAWRFPFRPMVFVTLGVTFVAGLISAMMCIAPALYVVPILSFVLPTMVDEETVGSAAIRRSIELSHFNPRRRLVDYPWVKIGVFILIAWTVTYALTMVVQLPFVFVQQFLFFRDVLGGGSPASFESAMSAQGWLQLPANVLGAFTTTIGWFYMAFGLAVLFQETRRQKEGQDLERAIVELVTVAQTDDGE